MRVENLKRLKRLMAIQEVSARQLAEACGYKSHAYITRILRGEITTVTPERAARIARHLEVPIDDLFVPRLSSDTSQPAKRGRAA
jgi:transcriptional regulator with XRE-family HTH domain